MLHGRPAIFIAHSEGHKTTVAEPVRDFVESLGITAVLVEELPRPQLPDWSPEAKVEYYLNRSAMVVALATPDDELANGEVHTRQNIIDEIQRARQKPHLADRVQVFKAKTVR